MYKNKKKSVVNKIENVRSRELEDRMITVAGGKDDVVIDCEAGGDRLCSEALVSIQVSLTTLNPPLFSVTTKSYAHPRRNCGCILFLPSFIIVTVCCTGVLRFLTAVAVVDVDPNVLPPAPTATPPGGCDTVPVPGLVSDITVLFDTGDVGDPALVITG